MIHDSSVVRVAFLGKCSFHKAASTVTTPLRDNTRNCRSIHFLLNTEQNGSQQVSKSKHPPLPTATMALRDKSKENSANSISDLVARVSTLQEATLITLGEGERRSRAHFFDMITTTNIPMHLSEIPDDCTSRLALLCFNGIAIELRDLFRILEGLHFRAQCEQLNVDHIFQFYDWFEGFYGIVSCIFDNEEDVLFAWLEKVGALKMENALSPQRRKTKKERTKDLCWDILELKMQFEKTAHHNLNLIDLILEMRDEAEQLTSRILMYLRTLANELPMLLAKNFGFDERALIEHAVINNFRATEPGRFVLVVYSRGFLDEDKRNGFLEQSFRSSKSAKSTLKHVKRFQKKHSHLADTLSIHPLDLQSASAK